MLYNPHCAPLFSSNYMLASQLQKMCFVTPNRIRIFTTPSATQTNTPIHLCRDLYFAICHAFLCATCMDAAIGLCRGVTVCQKGFQRRFIQPRGAVSEAESSLS